MPPCQCPTARRPSTVLRPTDTGGGAVPLRGGPGRGQWVSSHGHTPLSMAAVSGHFQSVRYLCEDCRVDVGAVFPSGLTARAVVGCQMRHMDR